MDSVELPLFPLRTVLCPGIALPLHIFEDRYRTLIGRCLDEGSPFGVVLLREGLEVGPITGRLADVGTTASIRQVSRHADGQMDIVTVGDRRFRLEDVDREREPWLVGRASWLDEPLGSPQRTAEGRARRVGARFLRYLELLRPALDSATGDDDVSADPEAELTDVTDAVAEALPPRDDRRRGELLMASARRLVLSGDATAVSYLLTGLVQLDLETRQGLLETRDTFARLGRIETLLAREIGLLGHDLRPLSVNPALIALRRN